MVYEVTGVRKCFRYIKRFEGMLDVKGVTRGERRGKDLKGSVDHLLRSVTIKSGMPIQLVLECRILYHEMKLFLPLG